MEKIKKIDKTLQKVYDIIVNFTQQNGYCPSYRELMPLLNVTSTSTINYYINKLIDKNLIRKQNNKSRAIEIVNKQPLQQNVNNNKTNNIISVPLLGDVAAGQPILAVTNYDDVFCISPHLFNCNDDLFMLSVHGESMINAGILNNDKIVVRKQNTAENGEIIVAMCEGSVTVKRFFKEKDKIRLQPENDNMAPIYCSNIDILGKVIGLIRNLQ